MNKFGARGFQSCRMYVFSLQDLITRLVWAVATWQGGAYRPLVGAGKEQGGGGLHPVAAEEVEAVGQGHREGVAAGQVHGGVVQPLHVAPYTDIRLQPGNK